MDDNVYIMPHEGYRIALRARFRNAFDIGKEALREAGVPCNKQTDPEVLQPGLGTPLHLEQDPSLEPCEALRSGLYRECASGSMLWLQRNDILTRSKLATHVRRGLPGSAV